MVIPSAGDIARIAVHCRDLLSAVDALCPGHVDLRGPFVKRLFELGLQRLDMEGDLVKQQPSGWPQRRAEVQVRHSWPRSLIESLKSTYFPIMVLFPVARGKWRFDPP